MAKMWAGRTDGNTNSLCDDFNSSIGFDSRMYRQDIRGSIAHAKMLAKQKIIGSDDADQIISGLNGILEEMESGKLLPDPSCEDIHMFVEQVLTERIGAAGKKLHTARSRNDQVALDTRLWLRDEIDLLSEKIHALILTVADKAEENKAVIAPGYTHMQRAQPITFGHHLLCYCMMLLRDIDRLSDCKKRMNVSPIGSCALAGTTYDTDRFYEAELLGFDSVCENSIDGVSDRDFCVEATGCLALLMTHLSRFAEELILWSGFEFGFVELDDAFTTGSSIMPQKKNPDMAELVRGKTGRVYGDLTALLTTLKGIPLAYNKDMQEDKESLFDACDTACACLDIFNGMLAGMKTHPQKMRRAANEGFINATDLADYLVGKGIPFRQAYGISGRLVARCIADQCTLETLPLNVYQEYCSEIDDGVFKAVDIEACVSRRTSYGGTSVASVEHQIDYVRNTVKKY